MFSIVVMVPASSCMCCMHCRPVACCILLHLGARLLPPVAPVAFASFHFLHCLTQRAACCVRAGQRTHHEHCPCTHYCPCTVQLSVSLCVCVCSCCSFNCPSVLVACLPACLSSVLCSSDLFASVCRNSLSFTHSLLPSIHTALINDAFCHSPTLPLFVLLFSPSLCVPPCAALI